MRAAGAAMLHLLACPACGEPLAPAKGNGLACAGCGSRFDVHDGIVDLRQHRKDYYFNPVRQERMRELILNFHQTSWIETVQAFMRDVGDNQDWLDNLVVDGRYAWRLLLDLPQDGIALDLGCGLGNLAKNLAPNVGHVVGMDLTMERLEFARARFAMSDCSDRTTLIAAGDGLYLPFRDNSFDLVTLSDVLEWIPDDERVWAGPGGRIRKAARMVLSHFGRSNPRRVQIEFLREIHRILKPDGQLFVAIENRLGRAYFRGMPDHHSGLKFNSLLPRLAANLYSIAFALKPYRTYTYSIPGFTRLFQRSGYAQQEFYGLSPGYTHLSEISPAWSANPIWASRSAASLAGRIKESALFVPAYGIVVSKSDDKPEAALINRLAARIEREIGEAPRSLRITRWRITGKDKAVLEARLGARDVIVRIPLNRLAVEAEARNWQTISSVRHRPDAVALTPAPIVHGVEQGLAFFVESKISGVPLTDIIVGGRDAAAFVAEAMALPERYGGEPGWQRSVTLAGAEYRNLVQEPLDRVAALCGISRSNRLSNMLRESLHGVAVTLGLSHGDLTTDNVFVDSAKISGVVDWEESRDRGMPLLDVIAFIESVCRVRSPGLTVAETFPSLGGEMGVLVPAEIAALEAAFDRFAMPRRCREALARLAWVHHCDALSRTHAAFDGPAIRRRVAGLFPGDERGVEMPLAPSSTKR